jgi:hypothetical protein
MAQDIDYTTWRKGKKVGRNKIDVCPKCGRKGEVRPPFQKENGKWVFGTCTHKARIVTMGGFQMREITDQCFIRPPEEGKGQDA